MRVSVVGPPSAIRGSKVGVESLKKRALGMLKALHLEDSELSIALVDDTDMARLNGEWRQQARPTDVLSFSLVEGDHCDHRAEMLGDVVISVETAARQAEERHRSLDEVVARLLIHGLLHLIGHDHQEDDQASRMVAEERRLWRALRS